MKKSLMVVLALVIVCACFLTACAGTPAATEGTAESSAPAESAAAGSPEPSGEASEEAAGSGGQLLIGHNNILKGNYSVDILENTIQATCDALDIELMVTNDETQVEKSVTNVDNMISAGVDGLIFLGMSDTLFPVIAEKCEAANVPFAIVDHIPADDVAAQLQESPMYVGGAVTDDSVTGKTIGEYAAAQGCKKAIVVTALNTDPTHIKRVEGFTEAFEAAGGEVLDVGWGEPTVDKALTRANDLLTAHPDVDCVYGTNGDVASATIQALEKHPEVSAKMFATDLDPAVLEGLESGVVSAANGAHWVGGDFAAELLINYLQGNPIKDPEGKAPLFKVSAAVLPSSLVDLYNQFWINSQPFSDEEMQAMVGPGVTYDTFNDAISGYTVESRLQAKVDAGLLTQEELDAALAG